MTSLFLPQSRPLQLSSSFTTGAAPPQHSPISLPPLPAIWRDKLRTTHPTMVSVSFRGWGLSSRAMPDVPQAYSVAPLAEDILALLDHFQAEQLLPPAPDGMGEFVLCGHSMGGKVALEAAALLSDASSNRPPRPHLCGLLLLALPRLGH